MLKFVKVNAVDARVCKLIKKAHHSTKIKNIKRKIPNHDRYITTYDFNTFSDETSDERLRQSKLVAKTDIADFAKKTYFDEKPKNIIKMWLRIKQNM